MSKKIKRIAEPSKIQFFEKRSEFIGFSTYVENEEMALEIIKQKKKEYQDATHNVYAYVIGENIARYSDDNEPQGTAGMPVLNAIRMSGISDVLVVVTRYFGGILLGAGGLVRAYTEAAKQGLKNAEIKEVIKTKKITFEFSYELKDKILFLLKKEEYEDKEILYGENVRIIINIPEEDEKIFLEKLIEITEAKVNFIEP